MKKYYGPGAAILLSALLSLCGCTQPTADTAQETAGETVMDREQEGTIPANGKEAVQESTGQDGTDDAVQRAEPAAMRQYQDEIQRAESVCPYDGGILVSNFGNGKGGYVLYRKEDHTEMIIAPGEGLVNPTGLAAGNGMVFICDGDALKVFEMENPGKIFCEIHLDSSGHLFNDVAVDGKYLYLSVTDLDAIYRMDISDKDSLGNAVLEQFVKVPGPNGIILGNGAMYVAAISKDFTSVGEDCIIYVIPDLTAPKAERLVDVPGLYDGVALSDDGSTLYYSDWNTASIEAVNLISGERKQIYQEDGMGPADIAQKDGILYVPDLPGSRILEFTVEDRERKGMVKGEVGVFDLDRKRVLLNNGMEMPIIGLGTYGLSPEEAENSVYYALEAGYRLLDTANAYMNERAVGRGIRKAIEEGLVTREEIFLTTKLWVSEYETVESSIEETLERLDVDYIDLLLLHQPYGSYTMAYQELEKAVESGKVRAIGLSNFYDNRYQEILEAAAVPPAVLQIETNPLNQQLDTKEVLAKHQVQLEAWSPLGGRGHTDELFGSQVLAEIAQAHDKSVVQVILRWHMQTGNVAIPGSRNPDHIRENIDIFDFALTEEEMGRINGLDTGVGVYDFSPEAVAGNDSFFESAEPMDFDAQE